MPDEPSRCAIYAKGVKGPEIVALLKPKGCVSWDQLFVVSSAPLLSSGMSTGHKARGVWDRGIGSDLVVVVVAAVVDSASHTHRIRKQSISYHTILYSGGVKGARVRPSEKI